MQTKDPNGGYSVRNVKTFMGHEGYGFNATLCKDGTPIADVIDEGNGGTCYFTWQGAPETRREMQDALHAFVQTLPPNTTYPDQPLPVDEDMFVSQLVDDFTVLGKLRRSAKQAVLMVEDGKLLRMKPRNGRTVADVLAFARTKYPGAVILNDRPEAEWLALLPKAA